MSTKPKADSEPTATTEVEETAPSKPRRNFWEAFKNFAIVFSFIVNFILVLVLILAPFPTLVITDQFAKPLLKNLDDAFAALGQTVIKADVPLNQTMPIKFDLPLNQDTVVVLTEPVPLQANATFMLPGGGGAINGTVSLNLPTGLALPVTLDLMVPVSTTIPVVLNVPVELNLDKSGMGPAIEQLRGVFSPLSDMLNQLPTLPIGKPSPQ